MGFSFDMSIVLVRRRRYDADGAENGAVFRQGGRLPCRQPSSACPSPAGAALLPAAVAAGYPWRAVQDIRAPGAWLDDSTLALTWTTLRFLSGRRHRIPIWTPAWKLVPILEATG